MMPAQTVMAAANAATALRTRKPTGNPPWPMVLLEGEEKTGKSYSAAAFSASPHIGRTFWFDLGEGAADEYGAIPGVRYEVVDHNGSYPDFHAQLKAAIAVPIVDGKPNCIVIDSITALWSLLCDEAAETTAARKKNDITMDLWNVAKRKWRTVMDALMSYPGIVLLTARGKEVAIVEGGRPTNGKTWKVEGEKSLAYDVTAWVRLTQPRKAELIGVRSLKLVIPEGRTLPLPQFDLQKFIFDQLGLADLATGSRNYKPAVAETGVAVGAAQSALVQAVMGDREAAIAIWTEASMPSQGSITDDQMAALLTTAASKVADLGPDTDEFGNVVPDGVGVKA